MLDALDILSVMDEALAAVAADDVDGEDAILTIRAIRKVIAHAKETVLTYGKPA